MSVKEVFIIHQAICITQGKYLLMGASSGKFSKSGSWDLCQHGPHDLMADPTDIQSNSFVELSGFLDDKGIGGMNLRKKRSSRVR